MEKTDISLLTDNFFEAIGKEWMIVTSGCMEHYNMMTASWGGIGWLWNKPVAFVFIRPERYTFDFIERTGRMTLSFLGKDEKARAAYNLCGSKSGRDTDKTKESGLIPVGIGEKGEDVGYAQSRLTLVCKTLYADDLKAESFAEREICGKWYGKAGGYHKMYIVEIEEAFVNRD